jgi:WD40 repeat protein
MRKFWSYITNGEYSVGCTGQTVYLYDSNGNEIGKFKDIIYAYDPMFSPNGKIFIVKSAEGRLAVYSLESFSLVKKFRFSKVDCSQDDGFCFSPDGRYFINLERQVDDLHSAISVYNTEDFSRVSQLLLDENMMVSHIELVNGEYYVLGFMRGTNGVLSDCFVGKFENNEIKDTLFISEQEHEFYNDYLDLKLMGFTEKAYEWSRFEISLDKLRSADHSLAKLWKYYNEK